MPGGYIGVDVFFVISGFLITTLILNDSEKKEFSLVNFWQRRILRILPALLAMVIATLAASSLVFYATELPNIGSNGVASLLSFSNFSHWLTAGNYWGSLAENSPLLHTWSLSVEEQFYLFFPLLLVTLTRYSPTWIKSIITTLVMLSLMLFITGTQNNPSATFYLLPTRAWELGIGAIIALTFRKNQVLPEKHQALAAIGLLSILLSYIYLGDSSGIPPWLPIPVFGAALVIVYSGRTNIVGRFLAISPMVYIGKISYSLYLWHWPVLVLAKQLAINQLWITNTALLLGIIIVISVLSYHLIEVPTRRNSKAIPYVLASLMVGLAFAFALKEIDFSEDISIYNKVEWSGSSYSVAPNSEWPDWVKKRMTGINVTAGDPVAPDAYLTGGIKKLHGSPTPEIVVLGDSHGLMWARLLDESANTLGKSIAFLTADATSPFFTVPPTSVTTDGTYFSVAQKLAFDNARLQNLSEWKPRVVVIAARWSNYERSEVIDLIDYLGTIGAHVLLIEQPPELYFGEKNTPQFLSYLGLEPIAGIKQYVSDFENPAYKRGLSLVRQITSTCNYCSRIAISDLFQNEEKVLVLDSYDVLYIDDDHLSQAGTLLAKSRILEALRKKL